MPRIDIVELFLCPERTSRLAQLARDASHVTFGDITSHLALEAWLLRPLDLGTAWFRPCPEFPRLVDHKAVISYDVLFGAGAVRTRVELAVCPGSWRWSAEELPDTVEPEKLRPIADAMAERLARDIDAAFVAGSPGMLVHDVGGRSYLQRGGS